MTSILRNLFPFFLLVCTLSASLSTSESQALKQEAERLFSEANTLSKSDPAQAREQYKRSALRYERLIREGNIKNGALYYNTGNAYFRAGMVGEAILNYRQAQLYLPKDKGVRQNLEYARQSRKDNVAMEKQAQLWEKVFFWHTQTSFSQRWVVFIWVFGIFWVLAIFQLFSRHSFSPAALKGCGVVWSVLIISLVYESLSKNDELHGVVIGQEVIARQGDSTSYAASFTEPLHAGIEFTVLERRSGWEYVQLLDQRTCWLPTKEIALLEQ